MQIPTSTDPERRFLIISHKPTARCDCRCRFCDSWVRQPATSDWTPTSSVFRMLDQGACAGIRSYITWGGEPLLVPDLPAWLARARQHDMETIVCTAANRLADRAAELGPYLSLLLVSLEGVGEAHDGIRGLPGLFDRVVRGLDEVRRQSKTRIVLWCNVTRDNEDQVEPIARFARDQAVKVEFFPATRFAGYNPQVYLDEDEQARIFSNVKGLKLLRFPVSTSWYALDLLATRRPFRCNFSQFSIQVAANGDILACEPRVIPGLSPLGNIESCDLSSADFQRSYANECAKILHCNACHMPCVTGVADEAGEEYYRRAVGTGA